MTPFACTHCGTPVYFENTHCESCGSLLGFVPGERCMVSFEPALAAGDDAILGWRRREPVDHDTATGAPLDPLLPCGNRTEHQVCNWMLDPGDPGPLCLSCRLTQVIPSLAEDRNRAHWAAIERAKRRLVHTLMGLGLTPRPIGADRLGRGLCFELLEALPGHTPVMTGHVNGVITLNIAEADDVYREATRVAMGEPVRSLLGHLRHEVSHYLQWRHVEDTAAMDRCRAAFGDERLDYGAALQSHYQQGAPNDWATRHVSAYASAHPREDWAETCAHYLLVVDALETAAAWGLRLDGLAPVQVTPGDASAGPLDDRVLTQWLPLAQFLNAMNRSLGQADSYPYLLPTPVLDKMGLVQTLLGEAAVREREAEAAHVDAPSITPAAPPAAGPSEGPGAEASGQPVAA